MFMENIQTISLPAGADLSAKQYHAVIVNSSGQVVIAPLAGTSASVVGILQNTPVSGEAATVAISGVSKVVASGTVTAGSTVMVNGVDGQIADFSGITQRRIGLALTSAAANKFASVLLGNVPPIL